MLKTYCASVLVLLGMVVAGATQECPHPDRNPTACCPRARERSCTIAKNYDRKIKRNAPLSRDPWFAETENECYHLCKHVVEGCKAVNYMPKKDKNKKEPNCEFMNILEDPEAIMYYPEEAEYISAVVNPSCADMRNGMYITEGFYRFQKNGHNITDVSDAEKCVKQCLDDTTCYAYNYNAYTKVCHLMPGMHEIRKSGQGKPITGLSCPYLANECACS